MVPSLRKLEYQLPIKTIYLSGNNFDKESREEATELDGVITRDLASRLLATGSG